MNNHQKDSILRRIFRLLLAVFYLLAGIAHIRSPGGFLAITPDWVPFPEQVVFLTGVAEIAGAIGLLIPPTLVPHIRYAAGIGLALYALCVFPANINHAINNIAVGGETASWAYHGPRLLFQPVFIWWALIAGNVINWPFHRKKPQPLARP
ncbi:DoxX family protein [Parasphingorhabdus cellanae]|uniref:DoxX family protein n=1 Tax=Parasphingorhabdus cellanae TaxID=2806553 RepID=A0ABX7T9H9_9SPHN|nr:DoxX family protein [Parasphingorhabdus cellanae]QTD56728.1 DoxX family protein [Parasphingorhabdus cellanae]